MKRNLERHDHDVTEVDENPVADVSDNDGPARQLAPADLDDLRGN